MPPKKQAAPQVEAGTASQSAVIASAVRKNLIEDFSAKLKREVDELTTENQRLKQQLERDKRDADENIKRLSTENSTLNDENAENQRIIGRYEELIGELRAEQASGSNEMVQQVEREKQALVQRIAQLRFENELLEDKVREVVQDHDVEQEHLHELMKEFEEEQEETERRKLEHEELEQQFDVLQAQLAAQLVDNNAKHTSQQFNKGSFQNELEPSQTQESPLDSFVSNPDEDKPPVLAENANQQQEMALISGMIDESRHTIVKLRGMLDHKTVQLAQSQAAIEQLSVMQMESEDRYSMYEQIIDKMQARLDEANTKSGAPSLLDGDYSVNQEDDERATVLEEQPAGAILEFELLVEHTLSTKSTIKLETVDYNRMRKEMQQLRDELEAAKSIEPEYIELINDYQQLQIECARLSAIAKRAERGTFSVTNPVEMGFSARSDDIDSDELNLSSEQEATLCLTGSTKTPNTVITPYLRRPDLEEVCVANENNDEFASPASGCEILPEQEQREYNDAQTQCDAVYQVYVSGECPQVDLRKFYVLPRPKQFDEAIECEFEIESVSPDAEEVGELSTRLYNAEKRCDKLESLVLCMEQTRRELPVSANSPEAIYSCAHCRKADSRHRLCEECYREYVKVIHGGCQYIMAETVENSCVTQQEYGEIENENACLREQVSQLAERFNHLNDYTRELLSGEELAELSAENQRLERDMQRVRSAAKFVKAQYEKTAEIQQILIDYIGSQSVAAAAAESDEQSLNRALDELRAENEKACSLIE